MKTKTILFLFFAGICTLNSIGQPIRQIFADAEKQTAYMIDQINKSKTIWISDAHNKNKPLVVSPKSLTSKGKLNLAPAKDWTSGFFPGRFLVVALMGIFLQYLSGDGVVVDHMVGAEI